MKRIFCVLMILVLLPCFALAEATASPAASADPTATATIAPTPEPAGTEYSCESFIVRLPEGMEALDDEYLAGYSAAVSSDYPGAGELVMAAGHIEREAYVTFSTIETAQTAPEAAREAALKILGSDSGVLEATFGANTYSCFACAIEDLTFRMYFLSNGNHLLCIAENGLEDEELMLVLQTMAF